MAIEAGDQYADEAKARWGDTDAYKESLKRFKSYSKEDIAAAQKAMDDATTIVMLAMQKGLPADSADAMAGAEAHRNSITDWWYPCGYEMHVGLAEMYISDPRFTENYEKLAVGFAQYMHDAIVANSQSHAL